MSLSLGASIKILAVGDFHGNSGAEANLSKFLKRECDCLLLLGDLTNFGPPEVAESIIELAKNTNVPLFSVPGNCDPKSIVHVLEKHGVNIHGKCGKQGEVSFVGLGGSNLTPFQSLFELTEVEIQEELASATWDTGKMWVLITHAPPHGTKVDQIKEGTHVGSKSIRQYIEQKQPLVSFCAHVHEGRGTDHLGRTLIINPGPITNGYAAEVDIINAEKINFQLLEL